MTPIQELLSRIQWDKEFGKGDFEIGYYDRKKNTIIKVALAHIRLDKDDHFFFQAVDPDRELHSIPIHRIREVYKDGRLIWHRKS